jgi:hypothetical protein
MVFIADDLLQSSGIHSIFGGAEVIPVEKKVFSSVDVVMN